jgi:hypothetical protein
MTNSASRHSSAQGVWFSLVATSGHQRLSVKTCNPSGEAPLGRQSELHQPMDGLQAARLVSNAEFNGISMIANLRQLHGGADHEL